MRTGIYVRISSDRTGAGLGVARQEEDCRALVERRGWTVAGVYADNDVSAYARVRKDWRRLLADVKAGDLDAVACWHVDRLTRKPSELEDIITLADRYGLKLATCTGEVDLGTSTGRMVARMVGAAARQETEQKVERQIGERKQSAAAGKVSGGGLRAYGYASDGRTVLDDEAAIISDCAHRALAGESLASIVRDLRARGVTTTQGNPWQVRTLKSMLVGARISGRREHHGRIAGVAVWPAIITADESDRLRGILRDPARDTRKDARRYLLTAILRCGVCGGPMVGHGKAGWPRYVCNADGCGKVTTGADWTDDHVRDTVLVALEGTDLRGRVLRARSVDPALGKAIAADEAKLTKLAAAWGTDDLSLDEWKAARGPVEARLKTNRARLDRAVGPDPLAGFTGSTYEALRARWDGLNVSQRRAIVAAVISAVKVNPTTKRWDRERFAITWKA